MKKFIFAVYLFSLVAFFMAEFNHSLYSANKMGRIVGRRILYAEIVKINYAERTITVSDIESNNRSLFFVGKETDFIGVNFLKDLKVGDYVELEISTSAEGDVSLLSIKYLEEKPDLVNHPD